MSGHFIGRNKGHLLPLQGTTLYSRCALLILRRAERHCHRDILVLLHKVVQFSQYVPFFYCFFLDLKKKRRHNRRFKALFLTLGIISIVENKPITDEFRGSCIIEGNVHNFPQKAVSKDNIGEKQKNNIGQGWQQQN